MCALNREIPVTVCAQDRPTNADPSHGYEENAREFMARRQSSRVGATAVLAWATHLPRGAAILDLGCGSGVPISEALISAGYTVYGVEASPTLCASFRERFPGTTAACESVEKSAFFGRTFEGVVAWGLMFLLADEAQLSLVRRISHALKPGGRFLFTAPTEACRWTDVLTGRISKSLGEVAYRQAIEASGLVLAPGYTDEGGNRYYDVIKQKPTHAVV